MAGYLRRLGAELRPFLACGQAVRALGVGSLVVGKRAWAWLGAGTGQRWGWSTIGVAFVVWAGTKAPGPVVSVSASLWCVAAWMHAPEAPQETPEEDAAEGPAEAPARPVIEDRDALLWWLAEAIGDRNGIHLDELHQRLAQEPGCEALSRASLTPFLDHHHIPYKRTVSVDGVAGRSGVRQADIRALLGPLPQEAPTPPLNASETGADLRESQPLSVRSQPLSPPFSGA